MSGSDKGFAWKPKQRIHLMWADKEQPKRWRSHFSQNKAWTVLAVQREQDIKLRRFRNCNTIAAEPGVKKKHGGRGEELRGSPKKTYGWWLALPDSGSRLAHYGWQMMSLSSWAWTPTLSKVSLTHATFPLLTLPENSCAHFSSDL